MAKKCKHDNGIPLKMEKWHSIKHGKNDESKVANIIIYIFVN
jgi:hypothetical protein